jgi:hypothetical protein
VKYARVQYETDLKSAAGASWGNEKERTHS